MPNTIMGTAGNDNLNGTAGDDLILGLGGDDFITGGGGNDIIDGGTGSDAMDGGAGADTYLFGLGYWHDAISSSDLASDSVQLGSGISLADLAFSKGPFGGPVDLSIAGTDDILRVYGDPANPASWLSSIRLAGGATLDAGAIQRKLVASDDVLSGTAAAETLDGGLGNDQIFGGDGNDILYGDAGNDTLNGGNGADTYVFGRGDGVDTIVSAGINLSDDHVELGRGIALTDVDVSIDGGVRLGLTGSADALIVYGTIFNWAEIRFADGAAWDAQTIARKLVASNDTLNGGAAGETLDGGLGNDQIFGNDGDDFLYGDAGDDWMDGGNGADTYYYGRGDGHDTIASLDAVHDRVIFGRGINLADIDVNTTFATLSVDFHLKGSADFLAINGDPLGNLYWPGQILFADGASLNAAAVVRKLAMFASNDVLTGTAAGETLDGGLGDDTIFGGDGDDILYGDAGNDLLDGGNGADTYYFGRGDGQDTLVAPRAQDRVVLGSDILLTDIRASQAAAFTPVTLALAGSSDALIVNADPQDQFNWISSIQFGDGASLNGANVRRMLVASDDTVFGTTVAETLVGGLGNDTIFAGSGDDFVFGGTGDDELEGGFGSDRYYFDRASGHDRIAELVENPGDRDTVVFGAGIAASDLVVTRDASDLLIAITGSDASLRIASWFQAGIASHVERFVFTDGTVLTDQQIEQTTDHAPVVAHPVADQTGSEFVPFSFSVPADAFADPDAGDFLTYSARLAGGDPLPAWLGFDASSRTFAGTPPRGSSGLFTVEVVATDHAGLSAVDQFNLSIADGATIIGTEGDDPNLAGTPGNDVIIGLGGDDMLSGGEGNDVLDGGTGSDVLIGGRGSDTYLMSRGMGRDFAWELEAGNPGDVDAVEVAADISFADVTVRFEPSHTTAFNDGGFVLSINGTADSMKLIWAENTGPENRIEEVRFADGTVWTDTELRALSLVGTFGDDVIYGFSTDDTLNGGAGADRMAGGAGNDTYVVDNAGDVVVEQPDEGNDTVRSAVSYALAANLENLSLTGAAAINGTGNELDNTLTGNAAANVLDGGAGADTLAGGAGDDTYVVDAGDTINELAGEGTDTVQSSLSYVLGANLENLTLTGTAAIDGTGNALNNVLTGNAAANVLSGGTGEDTYYVGAGDTVVENAGEGIDTVYSEIDYTLGANLENLVLTGNATSGTGNALANTITGNAADNVLDGGGGADTLIGGAGNDSYLASETDTIVEAPGGGTDTVYATLVYPSYLLAANVENLVLLSTAGAVLSGNELDNTIRGNSGSDQIDGASGADTMIGGAGGDTYYVRDAGDTVIEDANAGDDMVFSSVDFVLPDNVERLYLLGGGTAVRGTGNALDNVINGNNAGNILDGGAGADLLLAGTGDNTLYGGSGNDRLYGSDGKDLLDGGTGADFMSGGFGDDTYIVDDSGDVTTESGGGGTDVVLSSVNWTLGTSFENLVLTGAATLNGTGNALANAITGNSGDNVLDGGAGADTLAGGAGNDTYIVDDAGDAVVELAGEGTDMVRSTVSYALGANLENLTLTGTAAINGTGNDLANLIVGNSAANVLDGGAGADMLIGGAGDDTYVVDNAGDAVVENAGEGIDTVRSAVNYTLGANVENLVLTGTAASGTGNALDNTIVGTDGTNFLDGGTGVDTLIGGAGNDVYFIDGGDIIVEAAGGGFDMVVSSASYTMAAEVDQLVLAGSAAINGTGNALNNNIQGNDAANVLDGGAGADTLIGFGGDDTYYVDNSGDLVSESPGGGTDTVHSTVSYTLATDLENLTLEGSSAISGTGNALDNVIRGNSAANVLSGGVGNDTYYVGAGDTVSEAASAGTDTVIADVSWTLSNNVENLMLAGSGAISGTGNGLANTITGNAGNNTLDGGAGSDTMIGGLGNDTYLVGSSGDVVTEQVGEGTDTVISSISYTLGQNVENLTLATGAVTGTGNGLDNVLTGNSAANTLNGGAGNDTLDGSTGADVMAGGTGDDVYYVDNSSDQTNESAGEGIDTVNSSVTRTLATNLEHLILTGSAAINGTGNASANLVRGNTNNNTLNGAGGFDALEGGAGNDTLNDTSGGNYYNGGSGTDSLTGSSAGDFLIGGTGNDTLSVAGGRDVIAFNFGDGQDSYSAGSGIDNTVSLGGAGLTYGMLTFQRSGNNLILNVGASDRITFSSWYSSSSNRNVLNLQVVAEAMSAFDAGSSNVLLNKKVQTFDFQGLVGAFNASGQTTWALTNALLAEHLSGSDATALGGDLAYYYGRDGTLAGVGFEKAQDVVASTQFGQQAQTLRSQSELQTGPMRLG